jgi:hypothetical protein
VLFEVVDTLALPVDVKVPAVAPPGLKAVNVIPLPLPQLVILGDRTVFVVELTVADPLPPAVTVGISPAINA